MINQFWTCSCVVSKCLKMPETEVETPAPPANETVKEEAVKAEADNAKEEKKDEEKPGEETKEPAAETKPKKEKKPKEAAPPPPPPVHKKDFEKEVVYVYQFGRTSTVPTISPACLKLETWLKLNGIKFEVKSNLRKIHFLMVDAFRHHPYFFFTLVISTVLCLAVVTTPTWRRLRRATEVVIASAFSCMLGLSQLCLARSFTLCLHCSF